MNRTRAIWIACAGIGLARPGPAPAVLQDWEVNSQQISEAGQEIFEFLAPASFEERYEFASPEEIAGFFAPMQEALVGESLETLAAMQPHARKTLARELKIAGQGARLTAMDAQRAVANATRG